jgi:hypothetical protein
MNRACLHVLPGAAADPVKWHRIAMRVLLGQWKRLLLYGTMGIAGGYAYYYFIGCAGGSCPITGNPYLSTFWGGLIGVTLGWREAAETKNTESSNREKMEEIE